MLSTLKFEIILFGMAQLLRYAAWRYPVFRARLKERNLVAQLKARDEEIGRWFAIHDGKVTSGRAARGRRRHACLQERALGADLLMPPINWLDQINAQKDFKLTVDGPEDLTNWFAQTIMMSQSVGLKIGTRLADGTMRYCNMTNGGPVFVYVKDGKIVRMTPIDFGDDDPPPWTIEARGLKLTPPRKTTLAPHGQNAKSIVYSPDRLLYPMKRVDFDPNGERNPQNRGKSGYVRISWEEALDLVAGEIKRLKRTYGPGVMAVSHGSHHTWGNIGYYLSALFRFRNAVGYTQIHHNPDSWEGWYWGAVHHWGYTLRVGQSETYGTVEDCLQNCDMIVFWAADPEHQRLLRRAGRHRAPAVAEESQARHQGRPRRPYYNASAQFLPGKWFAPGPPPRSRWRWRSPMSGSRKASTTRTTSRPTPSASTSGRPTSSARRTASRRRRSGRRRRPAFRRRTCARSRASGAASASISRPAAGATATAAPAATRPASNGRG